MPKSTCCRSCPRCDDCPVVAAAAARARRREAGLARLVGEVLGGFTTRRELPDPVLESLAAIEQTRRAPRTPVGAR